MKVEGCRLVMREIRNPTSRNPKEIRMPKSEIEGCGAGGIYDLRGWRGKGRRREAAAVWVKMGLTISSPMAARH